uniref:Ubiquitin-like domain-containing protein n=1 Tax=Alexandrium andersonii TaxID=327968 RepID=A0A7S2BM74_9DINO|mmetsp:Transcript_27535/g.62663  ORF Transcript_27535/g.62663 Transcript_27535/m.62663 type:complete len:143 (+) Transcript_27535:62-490(+)
MAAPVLVRVQKLNGSILEVNATRSWQVIDVKKQVTKSDGTPWKEQKMLLGETELPDTEQLDTLLPQEAAVDVTLVRTQNLAGAWAVFSQDKLHQEKGEWKEKAQTTNEARGHWGGIVGSALNQDAEDIRKGALAEVEAGKAP